MKRILHLSFGKPGVRRDVDAEIRFHLEMRAQEFMATGLGPDEAQEAALAAFGDVKSITAECRKIRADYQRRRRTVEFARDVAQDLRFAVRALKKSPGFTLAILLSLALGIGANTAVFSLVNGVLIQPLPYLDGERLVHLRQPAPGVDLDDIGFSPAEVSDYRESAGAFETLVEYHSMSFTLLGLDEPQRVQTGVVSASFFDALGVAPLLGRTFLKGEDQPGAEPVLVLSHSYWQRAFGADPGVVGRKLEMNDRVHTVVGVLPPVPQYPDENDVYMPVSSCPFRSGEFWSTNRASRGLNVFARLKADASLDEARTDLSLVSTRLHERYPQAYSEAAGFQTVVSSLREELVRDVRPRLLVLLGITGFLLLIVVANVANLTLARLMRREREMAIRAAVGAGRGRLFRQLLTEGTLLALVGGGLALLLALGGLDLLRSFIGRFTTRAVEVRIDSTVLAFTLAVSLATGLVLGLLPALPSRATFARDLNAGGFATASGGQLRARSVLIASQVAVSFVLLIGAGLFIRSFIKLQQVDPGFKSENILTLRIPLDWTNYRERERSGDFAARLLQRVETTPAVLSTAVANKFPLSGQGPSFYGIQIEGHPEVDEEVRPQVDFQAVSPGFFHTMGIPLIRGRTFKAHTPGEAPHEVVINRSLARRYFGDADPIGRRLCWSSCRAGSTIVGVVGDVKHFGLDSEVADELYLPFAAAGWRDFRLLIRTRYDPERLAEQVRAYVRELDGAAPVADVRTVRQARSDSLTAPRITMLLMGLFAAIALAITGAGIAGIIAYSVSQRTRELGIRMALGADTTSLVRMVMWQALSVVAIGLAIGIPTALGLSRFLGDFLFETPVYDPITFLAVSALLILVAIAACLVPAKRATGIDPMLTLRTE